MKVRPQLWHTVRLEYDCAHGKEKMGFWAKGTSLAEPRNRRDHVPGLLQRIVGSEDSVQRHEDIGWIARRGGPRAWKARQWDCELIQQEAGCWTGFAAGEDGGYIWAFRTYLGTREVSGIIWCPRALNVAVRKDGCEMWCYADRPFFTYKHMWCERKRNWKSSLAALPPAISIVEFLSENRLKTKPLVINFIIILEHSTMMNCSF